MSDINKEFKKYKIPETKEKMEDFCLPKKFKLQPQQELLPNLLTSDLAPWNVTQNKYEDGKIIWKDKKQILSYFHFAHFVIENEEKYRASYNNEWIWGDPLKIDNFVNDCYDTYFKNMKKAMREISKCA